MKEQSAPADVLAIVVPREIVNADSVFVTRWIAADGAQVAPGDELCEIETSKTLVTVSAERAGFVRQSAAAGAEVPVGGVLGYLVAEADAAVPGTVRKAAPAEQAAETIRISAKAREKIAALGLDLALFAGRTFVRAEDVDEVAALERASAREDVRGPHRLIPLSPIQRRVARVMEQSVRAIPTVSLERTIDIGRVRERARIIARDSKSVVTEVDVILAAIASACRRFPNFNGYITGDALHVFVRTNVGVAVDVGGDLYLVVVRDASEKRVEAIAKELRSLQYLAHRRRLTQEHMSGGTITLTSMLGRGVHRFHPIPFPEQAAIIGIADPEPGATRSVLTLVFDHRVANGAEAAAFLAAIDQDAQGDVASPTDDSGSQAH
jgi:pyruvate/2-oxoglutarate dehydrogenase complex dihydrolipoamide acyltransferase (E2) component